MARRRNALAQGRLEINQAKVKTKEESRLGVAKRIAEKRAAAKKQYTVGEEIANSVTHGIGVLLSIAALVLLLVFAHKGGGGVKTASALVFGITLILEYLASTLYHAIQPPRAKRVFRVIDHSCIYLLIAGSYTPFALVTLGDHGGWTIFFLVWSVAVAGIVVEAFWREKPKWVNVVLYVALGWVVIWKIHDLIALLPAPGLWLLVGGGIAYTVGTVFYLLKNIRYMHSIWHLFVIAGSVFQFFAVLLYVY